MSSIAAFVDAEMSTPATDPEAVSSTAFADCEYSADKAVPERTDESLSFVSDALRKTCFSAYLTSPTAPVSVASLMKSPHVL